MNPTAKPMVMNPTLGRTALPGVMGGMTFGTAPGLSMAPPAVSGGVMGTASDARAMTMPAVDDRTPALAVNSVDAFIAGNGPAILAALARDAEQASSVIAGIPLFLSTALGRVAERATEQKEFAYHMAGDDSQQSATAPGVPFPPLLLAIMTQADFVELFRRTAVSNADLQNLVNHTDTKLAEAARQVLAERTNPLPPGYVHIPGGEFKGEMLAPFGMKATPVTNAQWLQGIDGQPRYVMFRYDKATATIEIIDISANPPSFLDPKFKLDAGDVAMQGAQVLVKLVDSPSAGYDKDGRVFTRPNQPVVGVSHFHTLGWLQTQTNLAGGLYVYLLPTDLQYEAVASNFGNQEFGTSTGKLVDALGRKLAHFAENSTADVDDPRYQSGPFGVETTGNVYSWLQPNRKEVYPFGLRGGSWSFDSPEYLRAAFRDYYVPGFRDVVVGFSSVVLPALLTCNKELWAGIPVFTETGSVPEGSPDGSPGFGVLPNQRAHGPISHS